MLKILAVICFLFAGCTSTEKQCQQELDMFCQFEVGKGKRVCLKANKDNLSPKCQRFFAEKGK
jgi:hypothetical protein